MVVVSIAAHSTAYAPGVSRYQAVVFDKDGTLIDVHLTWGPVFAQVIPAVAGEAVAEAAAALSLDLEMATMAEDSVLIAGSNAEIAEVIGVAMQMPGDAILATLEPLIDDLAARYAAPLAATAPVLATLTDLGVWQGVATNDGIVAAERQLEQLGWRSHFASVLGYDSGFGAKPEPGMLHESARRAGVMITDVLFVGDSETDRRTAAAAGCDFLVVGPDEPLDMVLSRF
mgnify:CR=1 FL=1